MQIAGRKPRRARHLGDREVARERALRDAAQRGRVRDWALGACDPEVDCEVRELIVEGTLASEICLSDQRARWEYLEAAWGAAGRPVGSVEIARRAIAWALSRPSRAA